MKQNHKHTPLSTEELVKLLELNTHNESDLSELTDFEKEAFEGFSTNLSPMAAKELMDEVQLDISKKVSNTLNNNPSDSSKKNKLIWFSAAASLLLIIGLSVLLIKKSDIASEQSLALNKNSSMQEPSPTPSELTNTSVSDTKPETTLGEPKMDNEGVKTKTNSQKTISNELSFPIVSNGAGKSAKNAGPTSGGLVNTSITQSNTTGYAYDNSAGVINKDKNVNTDFKNVTRESNNSNDIEQDNLSKNQSGITDEVASVPANANAVIKSEEKEAISLAYEKAANNKMDEKKENSKQPVSLAETNSNNYRKETSIDGDKMESESRAYTTIAQNTTVTKPIQNTPASYIGGERSIKDYILAYHKKINSTDKLQGTFMIKAKIKKDGKLELISINPMSKDYSNCKDFLKEALNTMNDWKSATTNGTKIDSETKFIVTF